MISSRVAVILLVALCHTVCAADKLRELISGISLGDISNFNKIREHLFGYSAACDRSSFRAFSNMRLPKISLDRKTSFQLQLNTKGSKSQIFLRNMKAIDNKMLTEKGFKTETLRKHHLGMHLEMTTSRKGKRPTSTRTFISSYYQALVFMKVSPELPCGMLKQQATVFAATLKNSCP